MTNDEEVYIKSDGFTDHGHDHKGSDRGAEQHPFIGYNFRDPDLLEYLTTLGTNGFEIIIVLPEPSRRVLTEIAGLQNTFRAGGPRAGWKGHPRLDGAPVAAVVSAPS